MKSEESAEERELDQQLQEITDRKKKLFNSTRHIDQELWDLARRQMAIKARQQHLKEERYRKERWDEKANYAYEMEEEMDELRSENRHLVESVSARNDEIRSLKTELVAVKKKVATVDDAAQRDRAMKKQYVQNRKQMNSMGKELESLWRVNHKLRNQLAASDAMATETRLRQLSRLKKMSAETERLKQELSSQHQQRQQMQERRLQEAGLQHLGN